MGTTALFHAVDAGKIDSCALRNNGLAEALKLPRTFEVASDEKAIKG